MRNFLIFTLLLISKQLFACGFYPYGEYNRISLLDPHAFGYYSYAEFNYSSNLFGSFYSDTLKFPSNYIDPNTRLWSAYCRGKVDLKSITYAVYKLKGTDITEHSPNSMIQYLYKLKDQQALNYLRFAKNCEFFNSWEDDPWERQTFYSLPKRKELVNKAIKLSKQASNKEIKRRYAFLAIRLAWYNQQFELIDSIFDKTFKNSSNKDILYYWSLYFKSFTAEDAALANFQLAQVFAYAEDKRFVCHQYFDKKVPVERALKYAKTKNEMANIYLLAGIEKYDRALPYLQQMYKHDAAAEGLSFLLLREINKIEDFVLTPYYTLFQPSVSNNLWSDTYEPPVQNVLDRSERDRLYAKEVLQFVNKADLRKVNDPEFWQISKAYLQFITRDYNSSLTLINSLEKSVQDDARANQIKLIKALVLTAKQTHGSAVIPAEIRSTIVSNEKNGQFIFAVGKELEYLGNTTDAALLYSMLDDSYDYESRTVFWKSNKKRLAKYQYTDYFTNYFDYIDVAYSPEQIENLILKIHDSKKQNDRFSRLTYEVLEKQAPRLYDLLGTKYIRQNKLKHALSAFAKTGDLYWNRTYTSWEDYQNIFDQNPFYNLKYTPSFIIPKNQIRLNKFTITKQLINYLQKAEDKHERDRDYYYFLVANAYYNMGSNGNVWMMRRLNGWSGFYLSAMEDELEFRQSNLAKHYYLQAKKYAKTDKFRALCLRMLIRCEENKIQYHFFEDWNYSTNAFKNKYYLDLKTNYPDYFDDLVSSCNHFEEYFQARR